MPLLTIVLVLVVAGVLLYLITRFVPMEPTIRQLLVAVVAILLVVWVLQVTGLLAPLTRVRR